MTSSSCCNFLPVSRLSGPFLWEVASMTSVYTAEITEKNVGYCCWNYIYIYIYILRCSSENQHWFRALVAIAHQYPLLWRQNGYGSVSNHQPHDCLLNRYADADHRRHQSSASLAFVRGIHRWPVNSPHKWPVTLIFFSIWWRHHVKSEPALIQGIGK